MRPRHYRGKRTTQKHIPEQPLASGFASTAGEGGLRNALGADRVAGGGYNILIVKKLRLRALPRILAAPGARNAGGSVGWFRGADRVCQRTGNVRKPGLRCGPEFDIAITHASAARPGIVHVGHDRHGIDRRDVLAEGRAGRRRGLPVSCCQWRGSFGPERSTSIFALPVNGLSPVRTSRFARSPDVDQRPRLPECHAARNHHVRARAKSSPAPLHFIRAVLRQHRPASPRRSPASASGRCAARGTTQTVPFASACRPLRPSMRPGV